MANQIEAVNGIAITSIEEINGLTDDNIGKLNTLEFTGVTFTAATGGSITTSGDYKYHAFTSSGTFQVTSIDDDPQVDYLVIGGGGGGNVNGGLPKGGTIGQTGNDGDTNQGDGGGGAGRHGPFLGSAHRGGGAGGSGVVILKYKFQ